MEEKGEEGGEEIAEEEGDGGDLALDGEDGDEEEQGDADALEDVEGAEPGAGAAGLPVGELAEVELEEVAPGDEFEGAEEAFADPGEIEEAGAVVAGEEIDEDEAGAEEEHGRGEAADVVPGIVGGVAGISEGVGEDDADEVTFEHHEDGDGARHVDELQS